MWFFQTLHPTAAFRLSSLLEDAVAEAEARGERRVRVIVGVRSADSVAAVKGALAHLGVNTLARESQSFLAARLTRDEIRQVSRLTHHVKAIWLDRPVSAAQ
jgi:hypothetical protein